MESRMNKNNRHDIYGSRLKDCAVPSYEEIKPDTPLRLDIAAAMAFPDGSLKASGLRREAARGRLIIERIAGKDFTTLANINRMRELCRVESNHPDSTSDIAADARLPGLSSIMGARSAQARAKMISAQLKKH
jgi:hypothetical protein